MPAQCFRRLHVQRGLATAALLAMTGLAVPALATPAELASPGALASPAELPREDPCSNEPAEYLAPQTVQPLEGKLKGQLSVTWAFDTGSCTHGRLTVHDPRQRTLQVIEADVDLTYAQVELEFQDVNGDGYEDLVFYDAQTGTAGATRGADVYLWSPKLEQFVQSQTLSQAGLLTPSRRKGCVDVSVKCSPMSWHQRTMCFNLGQGLWHVVADDNCPAPDQ